MCPIMTQVTSQELYEARKGKAKKISLETTARNIIEGTVQT